MTRKEKETLAELRTWDVRHWLQENQDTCRSLAQQAEALGEDLARNLRRYLSQNRNQLPWWCQSDQALNSVNWKFCAALCRDVAEIGA